MTRLKEKTYSLGNNSEVLVGYGYLHFVNTEGIESSNRTTGVVGSIAYKDIAENPLGGGPAADCHQYTAKDEPNVKYVSPDGSREIIFNSKGKVVTDPKDFGTYNFANKTGKYIVNGFIEFNNSAIQFIVDLF